MEEIVLKPCPFCGYEHPLMRYNGYTAIYAIECPNCQTVFRNDFTAGRDQSKEKTAEAWNRRAAHARD